MKRIGKPAEYQGCAVAAVGVAAKAVKAICKDQDVTPDNDRSPCREAAAQSARLLRLAEERLALVQGRGDDKKKGSRRAGHGPHRLGQGLHT